MGRGTCSKKRDNIDAEAGGDMLFTVITSSCPFD
jgi:hypothetical protein